MLLINRRHFPISKQFITNNEIKVSLANLENVTGLYNTNVENWRSNAAVNVMAKDRVQLCSVEVKLGVTIKILLK